MIWKENTEIKLLLFVGRTVLMEMGMYISYMSNPQQKAISVPGIVRTHDGMSNALKTKPS